MSRLPDHGTNARYVRGCRCDDCRRATRGYHKRLMLDHHRGRPRLVDALGTRRRIEALGALGWTGAQVGAELGVTGEHVRQLRGQRRVTRSLAARVSAVYERLAMRLPPETTRTERHNASRQRNKARRLGWLPPLAWVSIDDPNERPDLTVRDNLPDRVVIERILSGDFTLAATATPDERRVIVARWRADGRAVNELERATGWQPQRYSQEVA